MKKGVEREKSRWYDKDFPSGVLKHEHETGIRVMKIFSERGEIILLSLLLT